MQRGRRGRRIPHDLRVVVRVQVDEARGDDPPVGLDGARCGLVDIADDDDAAVAYADIGTETGATGAVDHDATSDHEIEHLSPPRRRMRDHPAISVAGLRTRRGPVRHP